MPSVSLRILRMLALTVLLALAAIPSAPAYAAERVDHLPFVNNFATARCKLLLTVAAGDLQTVGFGEGKIVMPDRISMWIGMNEIKPLTYVTQIGNTIYQRTDGKPWEQRTLTLSDIQSQPASAQFNALQTYASAIYHMGSEPVGTISTERYQVWISGEQALAMGGSDMDALPRDTRELIQKVTYKYDLWVSPADNFLYQQNVEILIPEMESNGQQIPAIQMDVLMTFYDINDPNIGVYAPI